MSGFLGIGGGGFNLVSMVAQGALAAMTGGTSLIATLATQIATQIAKQVIQQVGQQLGLPESAISGVIAGFDAATGNVGGAATDVGSALSSAAQQLNLSHTEQGQLANQVDSLTTSMTNQMLDAIKSGDDKATKDSGKGQSILMKIAIALGKQMDSKMTAMAANSDKIGNLGEVTGKNQSELGQLTGKVQAEGQELSMLSSALSNTLKSIGDAASTLARKG